MLIFSKGLAGLICIFILRYPDTKGHIKYYKINRICAKLISIRLFERIQKYRLFSLTIPLYVWKACGVNPVYLKCISSGPFDDLAPSIAFLQFMSLWFPSCQLIDFFSPNFVSFHSVCGCAVPEFSFLILTWIFPQYSIPLDVFKRRMRQ